MNDNETFEFENRTYINPDVSRDEQTAFIDTLRGLQDEKNAQIATETHNLGTDVEPHLGGLSGSEDYWKAKYQTPQTNAAIADMKAVAQQSALNNAMSNYNNMLQEKYNQAYRDYNRRVYEHNRARERKADSYYTTSETTGGGGGNSSTWDGKTEKRVITPEAPSNDAIRNAGGSVRTVTIGPLPYTIATDTNGTLYFRDYAGNLVQDQDVIDKLTSVATPPKASDYQSGDVWYEGGKEHATV